MTKNFEEEKKLFEWNEKVKQIRRIFENVPMEIFFSFWNLLQRIKK